MNKFNKILRLNLSKQLDPIFPIKNYQISTIIQEFSFIYTTKTLSQKRGYAERKFSKEKVSQIISGGKNSENDSEDLIRQFSSQKLTELQDKGFDIEELIKQLNQSGELKKDETTLLKVIILGFCFILGGLIFQIYALTRQVQTLTKEYEAEKRLISLKWKKKLSEVVGEDILEGKFEINQLQKTESTPSIGNNTPEKKKVTVI